MGPISIFTGFLTSFLASALYAAAEKHDSGWRLRQTKKLEKLTQSLRSTRPTEEAFEIAIAEAFRNLSPIEAHNQFMILFSDIDFRQLLLNWMFALEGPERVEAFNEMKARASSVMRNHSLGNEAATLISRAFEQVVHTNELLTSLLSREDRKQILLSVQETAHMIDGQFLKATEKLDELLTHIEGLERVIIPDGRGVSKEFNSYTKSVLQRLSFELPIIGEIDRIEQSQVLRAALGQHEVLIHGEAGTGKTGIIARLARELGERGECVLFIRADQLAGQFDQKRCTVLDLAHALDFNRPLTDLIKETIEAVGRVWLIIDQLDQVSNQPIRFAFSELINRLRGREGCKLIIACRSYEATSASYLEELFTNDRRLVKLTIPELPPEVVYRCLKQLNLSPDLRICRFCGNLLNLFLLATLVDKKAVVSDLTAEGQLWSSLRGELGKKEDLVGAACDFAGQSMLSNEGGKFYTESPLAKRLTSWGILNNLMDNFYGFRHERLRDYFFAYDAVVRRREGLPALLERMGNPVRSKTVVPWMMQIAADSEMTKYGADLIDDAFNEDVIPSVFPKRACIDSVQLIVNPTHELAHAIWRAAQRNPKAVEMLIPRESRTAWANVFWDAGIFNKAASSKGSAPESLLGHLPIISKHRTTAFISWANTLSHLPPNLRGLVSALLECPIESISFIVDRMVAWIQTADNLYDGPIHVFIKNLAEYGFVHEAVRLLGVCTEPCIRHRIPKPPMKPEDDLMERVHGTFMHMRDSMYEDKFTTILGIPCGVLVPIFRKHLTTLKEVIPEGSFDRIGDPYILWGGGVLHLFSPGRTAHGQEWMLWYGLFHNALIGTLNGNEESAHELVLDLLDSSDLLEVRIALDLMSRMNPVPDKLVLKACDKGAFRYSMVIGESIIVLSQFHQAGKSSIVSKISPDVVHAIQSADWNRSEFVTFSLPGKSNLLAWAKSVRLNQGQRNKYLREIADFIFSLEGPKIAKKTISFEDLEKYCQSIPAHRKSPGYTVVSDTFKGREIRRHTDTSPEFESLHECARTLREVIVPRFPAVFRQAMAKGDTWVSERVGYVLIYAAQWRIDSHAHKLRVERANNHWLNLTRKVKHPRRYRIPTSELLHVYSRVIDDNSEYAPAIRAQFAGFLAMLTYELPKKERDQNSGEIRTLLRRLSLGKEAGCAESRCRPIKGLSRLWATAAKAVYGLIELAWQENYGGTNASEELAKWVFDPNRERDTALTPEIMSKEDRQTIISAFENAGDQQSDVLMILGSYFVRVVLLDHRLVARLLQFLAEHPFPLTQSFLNGFDKCNFRWLCLPTLKPLYQRLLNEKDGVLNENIVWDMACAFLIGLKEESMLSQLLPGLSDESKGKCIGILCDVYHWMGQKQEHWSKIRALWERAGNLEDMVNSRELLAFLKCLWGTVGKEDVHVPEPINTLAPLLEKTIEAVPELGNERKIVLRYLSVQSSSHPEIAVSLLLKSTDLGDGFPFYGIDSEDEKTVLQNAVLAGGNAYAIALRIIERQEFSAGKSLAGLLL